MITNARATTIIWSCSLVGLLLLVFFFLQHFGWGQDEQPSPTEKQEAVIPPADTAVLTVLQRQSESPAELWENVLLLVELGHVELAKPSLRKLLDLRLSTKKLVNLARQADVVTILRLVRDPSLHNDERAFIRAILNARRTHLRNPEHLTALLRQLGDPHAEVRAAAIVDLAQASTEAGPFCLESLANPRWQAVRPEIRQVLVKVGAPAVGPLLAALLSGDPELKTEVAAILRVMNDPKTVPFLTTAAYSPNNSRLRQAARGLLSTQFKRLPDREAAAAYLERQVKRYLKGQGSLANKGEDLTPFWSWDDVTKTCSSRQIPSYDAAVLLAARLADQLVTLAPKNPDYLHLALISRLEASKLSHGYQKPLSQDPGSGYHVALRGGPDFVERVLEQSLTEGHLGAATAAVEILGQIGHSELLRGEGLRESPLVQALGHADRRLRLAACSTIIKIDQSTPYVGSSRLPTALAFFISTSGIRRAVIASRQVREGRNLASLLTELHYDAQLVTNGSLLLKKARGSADTQLVLVRTDIQNPPIREVLYQLRSDPRTALLPVALLASPGDWNRAERLASADPLTEVAATPDNEQSTRAIVGKLSKRAARWQTTTVERLEQANQALSWIARLAHAPNNFYNLLDLTVLTEQAMDVPVLRGGAILALSELGLPQSQRALVDLAYQSHLPLSERQAAAEAFRSHVTKHGILLTTKDISRQFERYHSQEKTDPNLQKVMASILDTIERQQDKSSGEGT